jgi:hypothetical protein
MRKRRRSEMDGKEEEEEEEHLRQHNRFHLPLSYERLKKRVCVLLKTYQTYGDHSHNHSRNRIQG